MSSKSNGSDNCLSDGTRSFPEAEEDMEIRAERETDLDAVRAVNTSAFETPSEANLVEALRKQATPIVSLVAEDGDDIIGHIMFSPVSLSARC